LRIRDWLTIGGYRYIEIMEQGYECTGQSAPDSLAGTFWAKDYEDACQQLLKQRLRDPDKWGDASYHSVESGHHSWWGCGWYERTTG
jgi:hypothetical protein